MTEVACENDLVSVHQARSGDCQQHDIASVNQARTECQWTMPGLGVYIPSRQVGLLGDSVPLPSSIAIVSLFVTRVPDRCLQLGTLERMG